MNTTSLRATLDNPVVTFTYNIRSSFDDEYFSLTMRNKNTGEIRYDFFSTKSIRSSENSVINNNFKIEKSISTKSPDDVVEIELKLFTRHGVSQENTVTSVMNFLFPNAYALELGSIEAFSNGYILGSLKISYSVLQDPVSELSEKLKDRFLNNLSIGKLPEYYINGKLNPVYPIYNASSNTYESSNKIFIVYDIENLGSDKIKTTELKIIDPDHGYKTIQSSYSTKTIEDGSRIKAIFNLKTNDIALSDLPKSVILNLIVTTMNGRQDSILMSNSKSPSYFKSLISLTSYLPSFGNRFGVRDIGSGGDDWILPEHFEFFLTINSGIGSVLGLKINDLSKMNGGKFPPHFEHGEGDVFDGDMYEYNLKKESLVTTRKSAASLILFLDNESVTRKATKVIVSYDINSPFNKEISSTCLKNGIMANKLIVNDSDNQTTEKDEAGHKNHFHVMINGKPENYFPIDEYNICHRVDTDQKTILIKKCNGDFLDQSKFDIYMIISEKMF